MRVYVHDLAARSSERKRGALKRLRKITAASHES
jgi:hypothetical protein